MAETPAANMPTNPPSGTPDPAMLNQWYQDYLKTNPQTKSADVSTWTPTSDATVSGQFTKLTTPGSAAQPLMDMATTQAKQAAAGRGLLNSSMAVGEGQKAAYNAALPIAMQDAQTYAKSESENANATNTNSMFNAGQYNDLLKQQYGAGVEGFLNQQKILADQLAQDKLFKQQTTLQQSDLDAQAKRQQEELQAAKQRQADQIKADAEAQGRQLTAAEQAQIRDLEAQAQRQQAQFGQENDILKATQDFTTSRDTALFQQDLQKINAQAEAQIKVFDSENGTKLYDTYRETSQQTYDAYINAVQQIQTSDMDPAVKTAQIQNLQSMFATRQSFINTMFTEMPSWAEDWSTFDLSFGS